MLFTVRNKKSKHDTFPLCILQNFFFLKIFYFIYTLLDLHRLEKPVIYENFPFLISLTIVSILTHVELYKYGGYRLVSQ